VTKFVRERSRTNFVTNCTLMPSDPLSSAQLGSARSPARLCEYDYKDDHDYDYNDYYYHYYHTSRVDNKPFWGLRVFA